MIDETKRERRIGGSEIAALWHCHPYLDEFTLYLRKIGELPPMETTPRMRWGKILEQGIVSYYSYLYVVETEWIDHTFQHPDYPFMTYTPDARIVGQPVGIDAKWVAWDQAWQWGRSVDDIPDHCVMQAYWYLAATGWEAWDIVMMTAAQDEPNVYRVERDLKIEQAVLRKAEAWWRRYLVGNERPPITGREEVTNWLKRRYPSHRKADILPAGPDEIALIEEAMEVRRQAKCIQKQRVALENQVRDRIADHEGLKWYGGKVTWRQTKDSTHVDWKELADVLLADHEAKDQLLKEYTHTEPGVRRLLFPREEEE